MFKEFAERRLIKRLKETKIGSFPVFWNMKRAVVVPLLRESARDPAVVKSLKEVEGVVFWDLFEKSV